MDEKKGRIVGADREEKTLEEGIREAEREPTAERLRAGAPEEKGKPEAVNLEREKPVTNAARRRDSV